MAKKHMITVYQFQQWHPELLVCDTDMAYTKLANAIYQELEPWLGFMEPREKPGVAIGLAHYIEDIISETHQMEVFMKLYKKMYGYTLPFYDDDDEKTELYKMSFVLWHCICGQRDGHFVNPVTGALPVAEKMMHFIDDARTKYGCTPNDDLAGYLYSEETLEEAILVKNILMWIEHRSFLGRWQNNDPKDNPYQLESAFPQIDPNLTTYGNASMQAFANQAWPLSLPAQHIYAEMIRIDMEDPEDEMAKDVEDIKFKNIGMYHGLKVVNGNILMEDFRKEQLILDSKSGDVNLLKTFQKQKCVLGALFQYRGLWNVCGVNSWLEIPEKDFDEWCEEESRMYSIKHDYVHQYDDYIEKHNGRRMFFFKDFEGYRKWVENDFGIKNVPKEHPEGWRNMPGLVVFMEPIGQTTITACGQLIYDEENPYYDEEKAEDGQFEMIASTELVSPTFLEYALTNNKLPLAAMNDRRGTEYGWKLLQDNIEFWARCCRRDIKNPNVFCPRTNLSPSDSPKSNNGITGLMSKSQFLHELNTNTFIRSKASKPWEVIRADIDAVMLEDERGNVVSIETDSIYKAYRELWGTDDYTTSAVAPYVPKNQLSAATAIIYSLCGGGRLWRNLHKMVEGKSLEEVSEMLSQTIKQRF